MPRAHCHFDHQSFRWVICPDCLVRSGRSSVCPNMLLAQWDANSPIDLSSTRLGQRYADAQQLITAGDIDGLAAHLADGQAERADAMMAAE